MSGLKYKFKTVPDPHQLYALKEALKQRRYGIFFQQRVGKTKVAIDFCGVTSMKDKCDKILIVCPLSVRTEWETQIQMHLPDYIDREVHIYPKTVQRRAELLKKVQLADKATFIILNYDLLPNETERLIKWRPDTIIFDESHLIGHYNSKRSKKAYKLSENVENVLLLTGTPIPKKWYHIFGQFRAMDKDIFGTSFRSFTNKWALLGGYMGKEIVGCVDYEKLSRIISNHSIRVLRKDVFVEPNIEDVIIPVVFSTKAMRAYQVLKRTSILELEDTKTTVTADMAITKMMRLQQLCGGFIRDDEGEMVQMSTDKLDVLYDLVSTKLEGEESVVIFYRYVAEGKAIYNRLVTRFGKTSIGVINGAVPEDKRKDYRDDFQRGDSRIMLVQIATGAMGISLDSAHINIFYSLDFSLSNFQQAKDRIMGRNQHDDVTNYFLAIKGTMDYKVMQVLKNDGDVASEIADKWKWYLEE